MTNVSACVRTCDCKHCQRLVQYLLDDGIDIAQLGYEDVFTPLRHHSIALYVGTAGYEIISDMCYRVSDSERTWNSTIDPFSVWNVLDLQDAFGNVRFEVTE